MQKSSLTIRPRERGHAMVEFLLTSVFVLATIFGLVQLTVFVYTYATMAQAAKAGVRYAIVHGSMNSGGSGPGNTTAVENAVKIWANYPGMTITVTYPDGSAA